MHFRVLPILVSASVLAMIGCGSNRSDSDTLSTSELRAQASAICKKVIVDQQAAANAHDTAALKRAGSRGVVRLQALKPSTDDNDKFETFVAAREAAVAAINPVADALGSGGSQAELTKLLTVSQPKVNKANVAAVAAGVPACRLG